MERQISDFTKETARQKKEIEKRYEKQSRALRQEMEQAKANVDAHYARRVRELETELTANERRFQEELRKADENSQAQRRKVLERLESANRELRDEIDAVRNREHEKTERGHAFAERCFSRAQNRMEKAERMPCDFFCPGQFELFREHLESARTLMRSEMYEAAAAVADAAQTELELLILNVGEQQKEWEEMFAAYRAGIERIQDKMNRFEREALATPCGSFILDESERAYWSVDNYRAIREEADTAYQAVLRIEASGVASFLREGTAAKGFAFQQQIRGLNRLEERADAVISCIVQERFYSDQRYALAQSAEEALRQEGYAVVRSRFRGTPEEEPIDCYDCEVSPNDRDSLLLTFLPVRKDGVAVDTLCLVTANLWTQYDPVLLENWVNGVTARLKQRLPGTTFVWNRETSRRASIEARYQQVPDANLLARKLEKKYQ